MLKIRLQCIQLYAHVTQVIHVHGTAPLHKLSVNIIQCTCTVHDTHSSGLALTRLHKNIVYNNIIYALTQDMKITK